MKLLHRTVSLCGHAAICILIGLTLQACDLFTDDKQCGGQEDCHLIWDRSQGITYFTRDQEAGLIYWFLPLTDGRGSSLVPGICPTSAVEFLAEVQERSNQPSFEEVSYELVLSYKFEGVFHGIETYPLTRQSFGLDYRVFVHSVSIPDIFMVEESPAGLQPMLLVKVPYSDPGHSEEWWASFMQANLDRAGVSLFYTLY